MGCQAGRLLCLPLKNTWDFQPHPDLQTPGFFNPPRILNPLGCANPWIFKPLLGFSTPWHCSPSCCPLGWLSVLCLTWDTSPGFAVPLLDAVTTFLPSREEGSDLEPRMLQKKNPNALVGTMQGTTGTSLLTRKELLLGNNTVRADRKIVLWSNNLLGELGRALG